MKHRIRPLTHAEAAETEDPTAPFGRDEDGTAKAPFGYTADGVIKLNKGAKKKEYVVPAVDLENTSVREVVFAAFNELGGLKGLVKWGRRDPKAFYTLFKSMGPAATPGRRATQSPSHKVAEVEVTKFDGE